VARRNYLVEGLSGAGKSSVYEELIRRGYRAVSTDRAWKSRPDPDTPLGARASTWDRKKALGELESPEPDVLFVCGSSRDRDRFLPHFTKVFNLRIDDETMRRRLQERTNNDFGKRPEELDLMLRLNRSDEKPAGAIDIDATRPLHQVVDDVLRLADCRTVASDPTPTPWAWRGSAGAQSFVISESALRLVPAAAGPDELSAALRSATGVRIEYGWSGSVLTTLLSYLDEQGIDLLQSDRAEAGSAFVVTSAHREQHLAYLDPSEFDGAMLRRYYEESTETPADGVEYAMLDGIAFLRDTLAPLDSATVAVVVIG